ncbi:MAG TPA: alpha/beta hydrolase [Bryobacteraceae bacterium]|jgi:acetyl esterase/lipase
MKYFIFAAFCLISFSRELPAEEHSVIPLWSGTAPGAKGSGSDDIPAITVYKAEGAHLVPTAVIVFPGGGYMHLAFDYEGTEVAEWLNRLGISAFVLRYRLGPKYRYPVELWDAQRAIRYVRLHAGDYGVSPDHIGVWGFSAGGHLASTTGTHFDQGDSGSSDPVDRQSSRPDFMILAYPVITMEEPYVHQGSLHALLGDKPDPALVRSLSNESQVSARTPPCFLFHTTEDQVVPVQNSVNFYLALKRAGVPAELHVYLKGKHGVGLGRKDPVLRSWPDRLADWLMTEGYR